MTILPCTAPECVILLHGLCRTKRSMRTIEEALVEAGYRVVNIDYPSRTTSINKLADAAIDEGLHECRIQPTTKINFVTHSLGGLLVRSYLSRHTIPELGRVVMLGPPNQGSEVVDRLGALWIFKVINGPAGSELGTNSDSTPNRLGSVNFPLGVIAGERSINWINSLMIPGKDDGKVSVERTRVAGMTDHIVLPVTHPLMMKNPMVIKQIIQFLKNGNFEHL